MPELMYLLVTSMLPLLPAYALPLPANATMPFAP